MSSVCPRELESFDQRHVMLPPAIKNVFKLGGITMTFIYLLEFALEKGIHINVDNYQELEVITEIIKDIG